MRYAYFTTEFTSGPMKRSVVVVVDRIYLRTAIQKSKDQRTVARYDCQM